MSLKRKATTSARTPAGPGADTSSPLTRARSARNRKAARQELHATIFTGDLLSLVLAYVDPATPDGARAASVCRPWSHIFSESLARRRVLRREAVYGGSRGALLGELALPSYLTPTADGNILVCDTYNDRCVLMTTSGVHLRVFGEFTRPRGAALDASSGVAYVAEFTRHRVLKVSGPGTRAGSTRFAPVSPAAAVAAASTATL